MFEKTIKQRSHQDILKVKLKSLIQKNQDKIQKKKTTLKNHQNKLESYLKAAFLTNDSTISYLPKENHYIISTMQNISKILSYSKEIQVPIFNEVVNNQIKKMNQRKTVVKSFGVMVAIGISGYSFYNYQKEQDKKVQDILSSSFIRTFVSPERITELKNIKSLSEFKEKFKANKNINYSMMD